MVNNLATRSFLLVKPNIKTNIVGFSASLMEGTEFAEVNINIVIVLELYQLIFRDRSYCNDQNIIK